MVKADVVLNGSMWVLLFLALLMASCATPELSSPVRYYKPALNAWSGMLMGPTKEYDIDAKACAPTIDDPAPCVVIKAKDFFDYKRSCSEYKQASGLYSPELDTD